MKIDEYLNEIKSKIIKKTDAVYFRGQSIDWELTPSVFREGREKKEDLYFKKIQNLYLNEFVGLSYLDKLAKMQHYGYPTRLLDVTADPLIALYFACFDSKYNDRDGYVYVFNIKKGHLKKADSDTALILSAFATLDYEDKEKIIEDSNFEKTNDLCYENESVEKLFYEILKERPNFQRNLNPNSLDTYFVVQPNFTNDRIKRQQGAFIEFGLNFNLIKDVFDYRGPQKIVISHNDKEIILKELDSLGINKAFLLPESEGIKREFEEASKK